MLVHINKNERDKKEIVIKKEALRAGMNNHSKLRQKKRETKKLIQIITEAKRIREGKLPWYLQTPPEGKEPGGVVERKIMMALCL
jgi:hypothetical protein